MAIRKRTSKAGVISYQVIVDGKGETFPTLDQARRAQKKLIVAAAEGKLTTAKHTVSDAITRYLTEIKPTGPGVNSQLGFWRQRIGTLDLAAVTPALLATCRDEISSTPFVRAKLGGHRSSLKPGETPREYKRSASTVRSYMMALGSVLTACVIEWHWLDDSPMRKVKMPGTDNQRVRFLSIEERTRLLKACKAQGPDLHDLVVLALATGARAGELLELRWQHVSLKDNRAWIGKTKNGHPRTLALAGPAHAVLAARIKVRHLTDDRVFRSLDGYAPEGYAKPWKKALTAAKVEGFRFHDCRHTTASYLAMSGSSTLEIAEVLGHRSLAMVQRYSHLSDHHKATVVQRGVDKLFALK